MIPEEGHPAAQFHSFSGIEADIHQLRDFADKLQAAVEGEYAPQLPSIKEAMTAPVPNPADAFIELAHFLRAHWEVQQATTDMIWRFGDTTGHLAAAAGIVADGYQDSDAFSSARLIDVERALATSTPTALTEPTVALPDPTAAEQTHSGPTEQS